MNATASPELLCPRDAGRILQLTTSGVIRLERIGQLPAMRDSAGRRLFRRDDVVRVAEHRRIKKQQGA